MFRWLLAACLFSIVVYAAVDKNMTRKAVSEFQNGSALLLDVRENEEVAQGRVKGALVFPKSRMGTPNWQKFTASLNKEKMIYVYCRSGNRSAAVAAELRKLGFNAENAGGLEDLKKEGADTL